MQSQYFVTGSLFPVDSLLTVLSNQCHGWYGDFLLGFWEGGYLYDYLLHMYVDHF